MNKKTYITPEMDVVDIESTQILCASNEVGVSDETTDEDAYMSNDRRGTWGNLWAESCIGKE